MAYINKLYSHDAALHRYGRRGAMVRRRRGLSGLGDDACTPYGAVMQPDGTCQVAIAGPGSDKPIETTTTGSGGGGSTGGSSSSGFDSFVKGFANMFTPAPVMTAAAPQSSGISTTTLVIGGVALVGLALLMKSRK